MSDTDAPKPFATHDGTPEGMEKHFESIRTHQHYEDRYPDGKVAADEVALLRVQTAYDTKFIQEYAALSETEKNDLIAGGKNAVFALYHNTDLGSEPFPTDLTITNHTLKIDYEDRVQLFEFGGLKMTAQELADIGLTPQDLENLSASNNGQPSTNTLTHTKLEGVSNPKTINRDFP